MNEKLTSVLAPKFEAGWLPGDTASYQEQYNELEDLACSLREVDPEWRLDMVSDLVYKLFYHPIDFKGDLIFECDLTASQIIITVDQP